MVGPRLHRHIQTQPLRRRARRRTAQAKDIDTGGASRSRTSAVIASERSIGPVGRTPCRTALGTSVSQELGAHDERDQQAGPEVASDRLVHLLRDFIDLLPSACGDECYRPSDDSWPPPTEVKQTDWKQGNSYRFGSRCSDGPAHQSNSSDDTAPQVAQVVGGILRQLRDLSPEFFQNCLLGNATSLA